MYKKGDKIVMKRGFNDMPDPNQVGHFGRSFEGKVATVNYHWINTPRTPGTQVINVTFDHNGSNYVVCSTWCHPLHTSPEELEAMFIRGTVDYSTYKELSTND